MSHFHGHLEGEERPVKGLILNITMVANLGKSRDVTIQVPPPLTILPPSPAPFFFFRCGQVQVWS